MVARGYSSNNVYIYICTHIIIYIHTHICIDPMMDGMVREATDGAMARRLGQGLWFWLMGSQECNKFFVFLEHIMHVMIVRILFSTIPCHYFTRLD